jgi:hypothetical protein
MFLNDQVIDSSIELEMYLILDNIEKELIKKIENVNKLALIYLSDTECYVSLFNSSHLFN